MALIDLRPVAADVIIISVPTLSTSPPIWQMYVSTVVTSLASNDSAYDGGNADDEADEMGSNNWLAMLLFVIVIAAIGGNVLVCLAVCCKRKLQNMFNYFLVSLALSDMLSATLVMPLSIIKASIDHLPVPKLVCVAWYSLDVLFTSSTICHLCMISIDRYMTLTYPLKYGHSKKKKYTILKIAIVWIISFCIAGPLFILTMLDAPHEDHLLYKGCGPETPTFVISATVISFYLPLLIMTIMYALTVRALQQQLLEQRRMTVNNCFRSFVSTPTSTQPSPKRKVSAPAAASVSGSLLNDIVPHQRTYNTYQMPHSTLFKQQSLQIGGVAEKPRDFLSSNQFIPSHLNHNRHSQSLKLRTGRGVASCRDINDATSCTNSSTSGRYLIVADWDRQMVTSSLACSSSPSGSSEAVMLADADSICAFTTPSSLPSPARSPLPSEKSRFRFNRSFTLRRSVSSSESSTRRAASSLDKGRRAVQVLGILFVVFVVCYLPFFAFYVIRGTCLPCQPYISSHLLAALEWLAYSGSMLNPIIYHVFNPDFRRAFQNLLSCRCTVGRPQTLAGRNGAKRRSDLPTCRIDTV